ncbi:cytochrome P450 [Paenarthrobacter sp. A20]|uniref:cytochrome P450 n=1 Tax=Paenarthrobacter sp. A20 TaxID=2817891 RepID=UPI0020A19C5A|nr:cytochrome P450 [Paenarthrobacter sp. A20]MCP1415748.1 cytochrome P450 [Paenarthrobacter sp. A20]
MDATAAVRTGCPFTDKRSAVERAENAPTEMCSPVSETIGAGEMPVANWINVAELREDPYPTYARLRNESPVAWVPAIKKVLIASFAGCLFAEQHPEIFSNNVSGAHMTRAFGGQPMIRQDGADHSAERNVINQTLRPKKIKEVWEARFIANTQTYLDALEDGGPGADLNDVFAAPLAAKNLIDLLGLSCVAPADVARWSADFMAGAGNVLDDQDIWLRCQRSREELGSALDEAFARLRKNPDDSIISLLIHSGMPEESVRANVTLTISGGVSEPQHIMTSSVSLLTQHPEFLSWAQEEPTRFEQVFQETLRLQSPIAMITRETTTDTEVDGFRIPGGSQIGLLLASANRDVLAIENPDEFDPTHEARRHLGFGSGDHLCAGKWAAEAAVGRIAVPALYERFPTLRTDPAHPGTWNGWVFRGFSSLPVVW